MREPYRETGAEFNATGAYRYRLWRVWGDGERVCFCMLNPSTADAERDDPTIRRCVGFAKSWGYAGVEIVNLFAFRATHPKDLARTVDPVGSKNDQYLAQALATSGRIVAAWGVHGMLHNRGECMSHHFARAVCLGHTQAGHPRHPLYVRADFAPVPFTYLNGKNS